MAGKRVSIYVSERDLDLWQRVEQHAWQHRIAVSALVMAALEDHLARVERQQDRPDGRPDSE